MVIVMEFQKTSIQLLHLRTFLSGQNPQKEMSLLANSAQFFNNIK